MQSGRLLEMMINGLPVITNLYLTDTKEEIVNLTWKERLLSWPWKPHVKTKLVSKQVPSRQVIITKEFIAVHPAMREELIRNMKVFEL